MFNLTYKYYYSNADKKGFQGVGLLIIENIDNMCSVENIPNFKLNRALGINLNYNNNIIMFHYLILGKKYLKKFKK